MDLRGLFKYFGILGLLLPFQLHPQAIVLDRGMSMEEQQTGWLPYFFVSDSLGKALGVAGSSSGLYQSQSSLFATAFVTSNESSLVSMALDNVQLGESRWFVDTFLLMDHFTDQRFYGDYDRDPNDIPAGSNDSDKEDFATGISNEVAVELGLKYRLPIGNNPNDPVSIYRLHKGLLASKPTGGEAWNPMRTGETTFGARFFYTYRDLRDFTLANSDGEKIEELLEAKTNGLEFWLEYNNTDFPRNPSRGSRQLIKLARDYGWFGSTDSWSNVELDLSKYFNLGDSGWFRQQVLALNFWTSNTTSWETDQDNLEIISHRPPPKYGSELGGYDRLRAYPYGRFRDKAAVYYTAELRLMPEFQPLRDLPLFNLFEIDWWQFAPFVEIGRVGPAYNSDLFLKDLKWSAGFGIRLMAFRLPVRLDFAASEEGGSVWAMYEQPFSRQGN